MTTVVISQPMFFPWVGMFEQIALADVYVHYDDVQFSRGSFTNRVQLKTASGSSWLTVPLDKAQKRPDIADLRAGQGDWRVRHRDQVANALRGAPHLDLALEVLDAEYADPGVSLPELLMGSMERVATRLGALTGTEVVRSSDLGIGGSSWARVLDVVRRFDGDTYVTGHGASAYLDAAAFDAAGVEVRYMDYAATPYPQLHGDFTPYVTILDLLANVGDEAPSALAPRTVNWRDFSG